MISTNGPDGLIDITVNELRRLFHALVLDPARRVADVIAWSIYRRRHQDAANVDRVLFQYSRAAKELWKYCNYPQVEIAAAMIRERPPRDWWQRGAPRERS